MRLKIEVDFGEFYNDFGNFDEYVKKIIEYNIRKETVKAIKAHPNWKEFIKNQVDKTIEASIKNLGENLTIDGDK